MENYLHEVRKVADELYETSDLSLFECFQIATKIQQTKIIAGAFGVTESNNSPCFLEGIAISLGYSEFGPGRGLGDIIASSIDQSTIGTEIAEAISELGNNLKDILK